MKFIIYMYMNDPLTNYFISPLRLERLQSSFALRECCY